MKRLTLLLAALLFSLSPMISWAQNPNEFTLDQVFALKASGTIHMDTHDAEIKIIGSSRNDVHVNIYRKVTSAGLNVKLKTADLMVEVKEQDGDLYLEDRSISTSWVGIGVQREIYEILIEAPSTAALKAKGDDDDYLIKGLNGAINMVVSDGDIVLESCGGNQFEFQLDDGDIVMDQGQGSIYARLEDGDIKIGNGDFQRVDMQLDDGNIDLTNKLYDTGSYKLSSEDGAVELTVNGGGGEFDVRHEDGRVRAGDGFQLVTDTERRTTYKLSGGKAFIDIETEDGRVALFGK